MTMPGFTAENSIGWTIPYRPTRSADQAEGIHPQSFPRDAALSVFRCTPEFKWVWAVCDVIDGVPIFCQKLQFLGYACSY